MAAPTSLKNNRYTLSTVVLLSLFLLTLIVFSKRALEPKLSTYRNINPDVSSIVLTGPRSNSTGYPLGDKGHPDPEIDDRSDGDGKRLDFGGGKRDPNDEIGGVSDGDGKRSDFGGVKKDSHDGNGDLSYGDAKSLNLEVVEKGPNHENGGLSHGDAKNSNLGVVGKDPNQENGGLSDGDSKRPSFGVVGKDQDSENGVFSDGDAKSSSFGDVENKPNKENGDVSDGDAKSSDFEGVEKGPVVDNGTNVDDLLTGGNATQDDNSGEGEKDQSFDDGGEDASQNVEIAVGENDLNADDDKSAISGGGVNVGKEKLKLAESCDFYKGTWVRDESYPIYKPGSCPFVDEAFDCQSNGRPDSEYLKWRWKPDGCDLPRFNATDFLMRLRRKRLMLVGDSMNRNQFESLLCLLYESLPNKSRMYEIHGYKITKGRGYYIFKFEDYECTVEFVRSHFLVKEGVRYGRRGNSNPTLSIDKIDKTSPRWKRADILIFNTGHWWTHGKTSRGKNYYKEGDYLYPRFDAVEAYRRALKTWGKWIEENMKPGKLVFYRGYSSAHFRGGDWDSGGTCNGETEPINSGGFLDTYPLKMKIVEEVIQEMQFPVLLLNVTRLTNFRKDGHPSVYGKNMTGVKKVSSRRQDCSHWCLPGVPDAWNELIYATMVARAS